MLKQVLLTVLIGTAVTLAPQVTNLEEYDGQKGIQTLPEFFSPADHVVAGSSEQEVREEFHQTYPLGASGRIVLENLNGSVKFRAWDRNEVQLDAIKRSFSSERLAEVKIEVVAAPDLLRVKTTYPAYEHTFRHDEKGRYRNPASVDYTLTVPRQARLESVELVNGSLDIDGVEGEVKASSVNGRVIARGLARDARLSTVNGSLEAGFSRLDGITQITLGSVNGSVTFVIPSNANAVVRASTVHGGISNDFGLPVQHGDYVGHELYGQIGTGGPRVRLGNVNGAIVIRHSKDGGQLSPAKSLLSEKYKDKDKEVYDDQDEARRIQEEAREQAREAAREAREAARQEQQRAREAAREAQQQALEQQRQQQAAAREAQQQALEQAREQQAQAREAAREAQQQALEQAREAQEKARQDAEAERERVREQAEQERIQRQAEAEARREADRALRDAQREIERAQREVEREQQREMRDRLRADARGGERGEGVGTGVGRFTAKEVKTFSVTGTPRVNVVTDDGIVIVRGWDKQQVQFTATKRSNEEQDLNESVVKAEQQDSNISIVANANHTNTSTSVELFLPRNASLSVSSGDGRLSLEGVSGDLTLRTGDGSIEVNNAKGQLNVNTGDGPIKVSNFDGQVEARTGDGPITLDGRFTNVLARTGSGSVLLVVPPDLNFTIESNAEDLTNEGLSVTEDVAPSKRVRRWKVGQGGKVFVISTGEGRVLLRPR